MAGIYIHIPFCKQACHYCNFHFATSLRYKATMVDAICQEISIRKAYLKNNESIESIYFGGGTPSLLTKDDLAKIFMTIETNFNTDKLKEVTLEANPDDLSKEYLKMLKNTPVNRLSIGIQSFYQEDLQWMNRAHNAEQANICIEFALEAGFDNLTIDLIYGTPTTSNEMWKSNIERTVALGIEHISAYCLTVEAQTPLHKLIKKGQFAQPDTNHGAEQFEILVEILGKNQFEQYEISNFAKNKKYALHNTSYWTGVPYLGIGPSAHSYNHVSRSWNVANNQQYIKAMQASELALETEILTKSDMFNERIMTGLRTKWGVKRQDLLDIDPGYLKEFETNAVSYLKSHQLKCEDGIYLLEASGKLFADRIASDLFVE